ncbi:hypothetical protein IWW45_006659 [Coemansia sp. RSA 485]|nr:hypothetical protein IWW45_006659 [Coemansia sp. RSA 485]
MLLSKIHKGNSVDGKSTSLPMLRYKYRYGHENLSRKYSLNLGKTLFEQGVRNNSTITFGKGNRILIKFKPALLSQALVVK